MSERTLVLLTPHAVRRGLVGEVMGRIERKGLHLAAARMRTLDRATAEQLYAEHRGRPRFDELVDSVTSGPLVAIAVEGPRAVQAVRTLVGVTDSAEATPGSIRGDFGLEDGQDLVHRSDSPHSAQRELAALFPDLMDLYGTGLAATEA